MVNKKALKEELKAKYFKMFSDFLNEQGEEVLQTGSAEISIPTLTSDGEEEWLVITLKVPNGSRDGEAYDGYNVAQSYTMHLQEKEEKAKKQAEKKAQKIARDKKMREQKAQQRAEQKKTN